MNLSIKVKKLESILIYFFIVSLSFDYKGVNEGGTIFHFLLLSITILSFLLLYLTLKQQKFINALPYEAKIITILWFCFLAACFVSYIINGIEFARFIRVILPYILTGLTLIICCLLYSRNKDLGLLYQPIMTALVVSCIFTPFSALVLKGVSLDVMRYQILSPILPLLVAYIIAQFFSYPLNKVKIVFSILVFFSTVALSVTRSYLIILFFSLIFFIVSISKSERSSFYKKIMVFFPITIFLILLLLPVILWLRPDLIEVWYLRLFVTSNELGFDITATTRLAEYNGQLNLLFESFKSALFGLGMGSEYTKDVNYFDLLSQVIALHSLEDEATWTSGHSLWIYTLYSTGILFGSFIIVCTWISMHRSYINLKNEIVFFIGYQKIILVFYSMICVAIIGAAFTANPLGERLTGIMFGFGLILPTLYSMKIQSTHS